MSITAVLTAFLGVVIIAVVLVSGLLPVIADSISQATNTSANATGNWAVNFTGTSGLLKIIPLIFVASLITLIVVSTMAA